MNNKGDNFKEKFKQALISTAKVISDDYNINKKDNLEPKNFEFLDLEKISNKLDYIRLRANADSKALIKKFSNRNILQKNLPKNSTIKNLYEISEKIRCELLGTKILKGVSKNLTENYYQKMEVKRNEELKNKEDVNIAEAFELYMLKNFFDIKLNKISDKKLNFWEKDLNNSFKNNINYLSENLENQEVYNSKFSEILQDLDIFDSENDKKEEENNKNEDQEDQKINENEESSNELDETGKEEQSQSAMDSEHDQNDFKIDQNIDDDSNDKQNSEKLIQSPLLQIIAFIYLSIETCFRPIIKYFE